MKVSILLIAALGYMASVGAQMNVHDPDPNFFLPTINVGSNSTGTAVPFYGCTDNGATLQQLSLWATDQWIRGMTASLTDGRQVQAGCLNVSGNATGNSGCSDPGIRNANFTFQSGERIVNLTLYPGYNVQGQANQRAGGLNLTTSFGRYFSFGMTAFWQRGVSINVGAGIPCGVAPKAGADVDTLGFIFLRNITANALQSIQYSGVSSDGSDGLSSDVAPLQESANLLILSNQTYNNSGKSTSLTATFTSLADLSTTSTWTYALGLDSYTMAPVNGSRPQIVDYSTNTNVSWYLQDSGLHSRNESIGHQEAWNYTVTIGPHGASQILASATQGNITATFTAKLNVTLDSGSTFSVPVSGLFLGGSTSPVHVELQELASATTQTYSSNSGGHNDTIAWVVGVLIGLVCGAILTVLLAWALVLIMRRRDKKTQTEGGNAQGPRPKSRDCLPFTPIPAFFGKGKGVAPEDLQKDVELGRASGKGKWVVDEEDARLNAPPVVGVPVQSTAKVMPKGAPQEIPPQESEGSHVLPYNMFKRLRLDIRRQNNVMGSQDLTPLSRGQARLDKAEEADSLSNPASQSSTPRTIPEMSAKNERASASSVTGAESIEAHSDQDKPTASRSLLSSDDKAAVYVSDSEDEKQAIPAEDERRRQRMRDQIAQRLAQRSSTPPKQPFRSIEELPSVSNKQTKPKETLMDKISGQIAEYRAKKELKSPSGVRQADMVRHEDQDLRLGTGYRSAERSRDVERNTVKHGDDRIRLGVKYYTQGKNE